MKRLPLAAALCLCACGSGDAPLVTSDQITADAIPQPLISSPGDAASGALVISDRGQGHCVLCHVVSDLSVEFQGNVGPDLSNVGKRLSPGQLRLRIVDYQIVKPGTLMPSYYRTDNLYQVSETYIGDPVLSAQAVEDLVAYLSDLKVESDDP